MRPLRLLVTVLMATGLVAVPATATAAEPDVDTVGVVDPAQGKWHLSDPSGDVASFFYGDPGDVPFMGDWDCDGLDTPGLFRSSDGFVYLRNANTQGIADLHFFFGNPDDVPLAGDFDGDGCDTVSVYRPAEARVYIINELGADGAGLGAADLDYVFGNVGDQPFTGDFDGDGVDTIGLHRPATGLVYFRNSHTQGNADGQFVFGDSGDLLVAGDWSGDWTGGSIDTPALLRPIDGRIFFRYTNSSGPTDRTLQFGGPPGVLPVAGRFGPLTPGPDQVTGLAVTTGGGSGEIGVSWPAVPGALAYDVYWSFLPGDPKAVIDSVGDTVDQFGVPWTGPTRLYVDGLGARSPRNLSGGLECYRVAARDALGRLGPLSVERCFLPSAFLALNAGPSAGSGELGLDWVAIPGGVDRYDIYWSLLPQADKQLIATLDDTTDQFGVAWPSPTIRYYVDGLPPRPFRSLQSGIDCYVVVVSLTPGLPPTGPASAEVCFP